MNIRSVLITVLAVGLTATGTTAQAWDVPSFMPPRPGEDVGVYLTTQGDFGLAGIWRQQGNMNLGVRVGYVDAPVDGSIMVGFETWGGMFSAGPEFPVDVTWTLGAGAGFNDAFTQVEIPFGLSIGRVLVLTPITLQVYGHPRLALFLTSINDNIDADLEGLIDLGADVHLTDDWKLRLGATLGTGADALGIGLAYRFGRTVAVR